MIKSISKNHFVFLLLKIFRFFQAAQYAIQRRKLAEELCSEAMTYPEPDPLINEHTLEFFGQR